jgi:hypothetical protein
MNLALASITGTVTVQLDGGEPAAVGRFEVPVTATLDVEPGHAALDPAQPGEILAAAAAALHDVASRMLDDLPEAEVTYEDGTPVDVSSAQIITREHTAHASAPRLARSAPPTGTANASPASGCPAPECSSRRPLDRGAERGDSGAAVWCERPRGQRPPFDPAA